MRLCPAEEEEVKSMDKKEKDRIYELHTLIGYARIRCKIRIKYK